MYSLYDELYGEPQPEDDGLRINYRDEDSDFSTRGLLNKATEDDTVNEIELQLLMEYKHTLSLLNADQAELGRLRRTMNNNSTEDKLEESVVQSYQNSIYLIVERLDSYDRKLRELAQEKPLQDLYEREKQKALQRFAKEDTKWQEEYNKYQEEQTQKLQQELLRRYRNARSKQEDPLQGIHQNVPHSTTNIDILCDNLPNINKDSLQAAINKREQECRQNEKSERRNRLLEKTKIVSSSILWSIIGLPAFYLINIIAVLVISLIFVIISYIPVLNIVSEWLMRTADNTPDMLALCLGTTIAHITLIETSERIIKNIETRKFTFMTIGVLLVALNVIFLIINLISNDVALANIILSIAGIALFCKGIATHK